MVNTFSRVRYGSTGCRCQSCSWTSEEVILRRANCPCCSRITYACVQENCTNVQDHSLLLRFVLLTDAVAVHDVLYCRFSKEKNEHASSRALEHPDGIIGCKDKRAPKVLIVSLGQQCSFMPGHVFLWHSSSSNDLHKAPQ